VRSAARHPRGRHAAPPAPSQPVRAVLLGITAGALVLVALLPSTDVVEPGPAQVTTTVATPVLPRLDAPRAARNRSMIAQAAVAPLPTVVVPSPAPPPPQPPPPPPPPVDVLPGCTADPTATSPYANGQIPSRALCALPGQAGHALRADAAHAFVRLDQAFTAAYGRQLCLTDSYRSLSIQRTLARQKPRLAARPGTSQHGWGVAVDLACGAESFGTETHDWLTAHAGAHGWHQPSWAQRGGSRPEPWHWELGAR